MLFLPMVLRAVKFLSQKAEFSLFNHSTGGTTQRSTSDALAGLVRFRRHPADENEGIHLLPDGSRTLFSYERRRGR